MLTVDHVENRYLVSFYNITKLNVLNSREIETRLTPLVEQKGTKLVLNFSGIKFIDSSGFQLLLNLYRSSKLSESKLEMINISDELHELFRLVELEEVFQVN